MNDDSAQHRPATVQQCIRHGAEQFQAAGLHFGQDTTDAVDEAAALVFHVLGLAHADAPAVYRRAVSASEFASIDALFRRRVDERIPAAYLTGRTWFARLEFIVDRRALIPRSPMAELLEAGFTPWIDPGRIDSVLDLGTGGGCIAVAAAVACPRARVDAVDISAAALALASENVRLHNLGHRVRLLPGDLFEPVRGELYDVIISNPPYVPAAELAGLAVEYRHEPQLALAGGADGLGYVRRILAEARRFLRPGGILIVEVGDLAAQLERQFPRLAFTWLEFERGEADVFLLTASDLNEAPAGVSDVR